MPATKRERETTVSLTAASSAEEVKDWLGIMLPPFEGRAAVLSACSHLDGAALLSLTEREMKGLGINSFGVRRKLSLCIRELRLPAAEGSTAAAAAPPQKAAPQSHAGAAQSTPVSRPRDVGHEAVEAQLSAEASCLGICQWAATALHKAITAHEYADWASAPMKSGRVAALSELRAQIAVPSASVVVVGNTGAGKSTLLNALIGEFEVLPTNGMRACTAVIIELSFNENEGGPNYEGSVEFVSPQEWEMEMEDLLSDLTTQEGRAILHVSDPDAHNYDSWCKLYAVYGESFTHSSIDTGETDASGRKVYKAMMVDELKKKLKGVRTVTHKLGTEERVAANEARDFRRKLERYMDSANEVSAGQFWPIVKRCRARGRWDVLQSGAVFVDAPGVNDDNSSRDKVVKKYLKNADAIWIVSNINRAVNDKTAKDMLDHNFRRQLLMDGNYGTLVFVATQSDVLQRTEVIRSLGLPRDSTLADCAAARCKFTETRIQSDYIDGLEEMGRASGDVPVRAALEQRFRLPCFCVSAIEHQKISGVRTVDGPSVVWQTAADTQIPALRAHVHRATLAQARQSPLPSFDSSQSSSTCSSSPLVFGCSNVSCLPPLVREKHTEPCLTLRIAFPSLHSVRASCVAKRSPSSSSEPACWPSARLEVIYRQRSARHSPTSSRSSTHRCRGSCSSCCVSLTRSCRRNSIRRSSRG